MFGFEGEVKAKYDSSIMQLFSECFRALPIGAILDGRVLILHGGLFKQDGVTIQDIQKIDRFTDCMNGLLETSCGRTRWMAWVVSRREERRVSCLART